MRRDGKQQCLVSNYMTKTILLYLSRMAFHKGFDFVVFHFCFSKGGREGGNWINETLNYVTGALATVFLHSLL